MSTLSDERGWGENVRGTAPPRCRRRKRIGSLVRGPGESTDESGIRRRSRPGAQGFTETQGQYLAFIYACSRRFQRAPAEADMQRHFGVSPPSVHQMVLTPERAGLIKRQPGVARSIELLVAPEHLPILK